MGVGVALIRENGVDLMEVGLSTFEPDTNICIGRNYRNGDKHALNDSRRDGLDYCSALSLINKCETERDVRLVKLLKETDSD